MTFSLYAPVRRPPGFTLMELLVVISIIALLAAMTMGAFSYVQRAAMRNRTTAMHRAIISGLENYSSEFGEFPEPSGGGGMETFHGRSYNTGSAKMLYQALSGDGSNRIQIASGGTSASDGRWEGDEKMLLTDMPKEMYTFGGRNMYMLLDGFSHPFQYTKGGTADAINPTFDLWSYGEDDENTDSVSKASKQDPKASIKWIKNF